MQHCDNFMKPVFGTMLKMNITAQLPDSLHLSDVNFAAFFFCRGMPAGGQNVTKGDMSRVDDDNYLAVVNTRCVGSGEYWCRLTVYIPDTDCPEGVRPEIVVFPCGVAVVKP